MLKLPDVIVDVPLLAIVDLNLIVDVKNDNKEVIYVPISDFVYNIYDSDLVFSKRSEEREKECFLRGTI